MNTHDHDWTPPHGTERPEAERITWEITWWYADDDEPGHDRYHTRVVYAGPPNTDAYDSPDVIPAPLRTWAQQIGATYRYLTSISYAITTLLDLTDPPTGHYGEIMPGYQSMSTIHEDVYAS